MASALRKPTIVRPAAVHKPTVLLQTAATQVEPAILPFGDDLPDVLGLTFEEGAQHRKGLDTEDSMLRIASAFGKKVKGVIRQRVWPPREFSRGEWDAIILTDAAVYLIDAKRHSGRIEVLDPTREQITIHRAGKVEQTRNPTFALAGNARQFHEQMARAPWWQSVGKLTEQSNLGPTIPTLPVVCFGPTTEIDKVVDPTDSMIVCTTRNLKSKLERDYAHREKIIGMAGLLGHLTAAWKTVGMLRVKGRTGFLRATLVGTEGAAASLLNIVDIKGVNTGKVDITYGDKRKYATKKLKAIIIETFQPNAGLMRAKLQCNRGFAWTANG